MSVWLSYSLSDFLLFSSRTYYRLFELHNRTVWPLHLIMLGLGVTMLVFLARGRSAWHGRATATILAVSWLFVAWVYLIQRYDTINWTARYFAAGFALQAVLLAWTGIVRERLAVSPRPDAAGKVGLAIFAFALAVQPLVGPILGRPLIQAEVFAIAPDPTVVATLGVVLAARRPAWTLLPIPLAWCAFSGATLWTMRSPDWFILPTAGALAIGMVAWKWISQRRSRSADNVHRA